MKRILCVLMLVLLSVPLVFAQEDAYEPYREEEFPDWAHDLRRYEIIMIGAVPVSMLVSVLGYNLYKTAAAYAADPTNFSISDTFGTGSWDNIDKRNVFIIGVSVSGLIAAADYFIGCAEKKADAAAESTAGTTGKIDIEDADEAD